MSERDITKSLDSAASNEEAMQGQKALKKTKKIRKIPGIDAPDIRYRGPLSYQGLRLLGWLTLVFFVLGLALNTLSELAPTHVGSNPALYSFLTSMKDLMMPLFLLANFSLILNSRQSYKKTLLFFGAMSLLIAGVFYLYGERLLVILSRILSDTPEEQQMMRDMIASSFLHGGFNIFLDLFLCSLFAFFLNYKPKKIFTGRKTWIFRCFAILVAAYEIASVVIKILTVTGTIILPLEVTPWLTAKPIMTFAAFAFIALFIKLRERIFVTKYGTHEDYENYLQTNANSLQVSAAISLAFFVAAVIDFLLLVIALSFYLTDPNDTQVISDTIPVMQKVGIGSALPLFLVSPIALLFSYTRVPKIKKLDIFLPLIGIGLSLLVAVEAVFYLLMTL